MVEGTAEDYDLQLAHAVISASGECSAIFVFYLPGETHGKILSLLPARYSWDRLLRPVSLVAVQLTGCHRQMKDFNRRIQLERYNYNIAIVYQFRSFCSTLVLTVPVTSAEGNVVEQFQQEHPSKNQSCSKLGLLFTVLFTFSFKNSAEFCRDSLAKHLAIVCFLRLVFTYGHHLHLLYVVFSRAIGISEFRHTFLI